MTEIKPPPVLVNFRRSIVEVSQADYDAAQAFTLEAKQGGRISDDVLIEAYLTGLIKGRKEAGE